ncbi:MAG: 2,3-bisphosphoglycerate-independent phosphoglycerate mutase [Moorellales bacterium]
MSNRTPRPVVLVVLDGWGLREATEGNAVAQAQLPVYRSLLRSCPWTELQAAGEAVGLPAGQMGNSEVGHLNLGAGRIVYQELTRISRAIADGSLFTNSVLVEAVEKAKSGALHLMGLVSDGGVHSHLEHVYGLLELARRHGVTRVFVHAFLDGRDTPPASALIYLEQLEAKCRELGVGRLATVMGRYYAMDRDKRWDRTERAYRALVRGEGVRAGHFRPAVEEAYRRGTTDEFVPPIVLEEDGRPVATVRSGDAIIFFNFRADRARQLTRAFVDEDFSGFDRGPDRPRVHFVCLTQYDVTIPAPVAFPPETPRQTLGEVLAARGKRQLRIAETEKYAHVTFFFNGGVEAPNPGEDRLLIPSPKVPTYDLKPEMSAYEVTAAVEEKIRQDLYDVIIMNYANPDMVGHTGVMEATVRALEAVDTCLGRVLAAVEARGGVALVTGDHGNAEMMQEEDGSPHTAHTTNPVPFILVGEKYREARLRPGILADVAPTLLEILGIPKPAEMTGDSLLNLG